MPEARDMPPRGRQHRQAEVSEAEALVITDFGLLNVQAPAAKRCSRGVTFQNAPAVGDEEALERATAVEDEEEPRRPTRVARRVSCDSDSACSSIPGDTVSEADDDADENEFERQQRLGPKTPIQGNPKRGPSSWKNREPEVGNF